MYSFKNSARSLRWLKYTIGGVALIGATGSYVLGAENVRHLPAGFLRFGRAAVTVGGIVVDYKKNLYSKDLIPDTPEFAATASEVHQRSAQKLLRLCCINGGTFIKIGQHIGSLDYLFPMEYVNTLKVLHSKAPTSPMKDVKSVIEQELGEEAEKLFPKLGTEPLGAASLAQVHLAETADGRKVAVKVQHKTVKELSTIDMKGMELLVSIVSKIFPDFQFKWLVDETKINLPLELDFEHEGKNAERVARMFRHFSWLKVPSIDWSLSSSKVLTMEYCEGGQVNDPQYMQHHGISSEQVAERLGLLYSEMIFCNGYVHSDPHPGNVLVKKLPQGDAQIILLDHGLYANLSDFTRHNYTQLWLSILMSDVKNIKHFGRELGVGDLADLFACMVTARSWDSIASGISKKKMDEKEKAEVNANAVKLAPYIIQTLASVNRQVLLLLKTNDLLRGIESSLGIQKSQRSFLTMSRCCLVSVYRHQLSQCTSMISRLSCTLWYSFSILKVDLYQGYLSFIQCMSQRLSGLLLLLHIS